MYKSVITMSAHAVVPLLSLPDSEPIPFLSLPEPVKDVPESYGASLIVLAGVMPNYKELVKCWFSARYITMLTISKLRLRLSSAFPPTFNASPQVDSSSPLPDLLLSSSWFRGCGSVGEPWLQP